MSHDAQKAEAAKLRDELKASRAREARLEKRLALMREDQQRQEHINDNQRSLLFKVNQQYEALLAQNQRLTDELHCKNLYLSGIIEKAPAPIFTVTPELAVSTCNPEARDYFGLQGESCGGLGQLFSSEVARKLADFSRFASQNERPVVFEALHERESKSHLLELTLFPVPRAGEAQCDICCLVRDLTPVREELAERVMQARLVELGALSAGIAHEVNNPINGVLNYLQLCSDLLQGGAPLGEDDTTMLESSLASAHGLAERVVAVVQAILAMAAPHNCPTGEFTVQEAIEDALLLLHYELRRNDIELELQVPEADLYLSGRKVEVAQIVQNLMINAIQAHGKLNGDCQRRIWLHCSEGQAGCAARISVRDNGPGIDTASLQRLFHPFFTTKAKGTGLGLYLSRQYARLYGGDITASAAPGGGALFLVTLPLPRSA